MPKADVKLTWKNSKQIRKHHCGLKIFWVSSWVKQVHNELWVLPSLSWFTPPFKVSYYALVYYCVYSQLIVIQWMFNTGINKTRVSGCKAGKCSNLHLRVTALSLGCFIENVIIPKTFLAFCRRMQAAFIPVGGR